MDLPSFESKRICVQETLAMSEMSLDRASEEKAQIMGHVNPKFATQRGLSSCEEDRSGLQASESFRCERCRCWKENDCGG